jgi:hypothetical protein
VRELVNSNPITRKKETKMSANPRRQRSTEPEPIVAHRETGEVSIANPPREEEIRRRAYELYLGRGEQPGSELDDWFQAERELEDKVLPQAS